MSETTPEENTTDTTTEEAPLEQHVARLTIHLRSQQPIVWDQLAYGTAMEYYQSLLDQETEELVAVLNGNRIVNGTSVYDSARVLRSAVVGVELRED